MVQTNPFLSGRAMHRLSEAKDGELGELGAALSLSDAPDDAIKAAASADGADGADGKGGGGGEGGASSAADEDDGAGDAADHDEGTDALVPPVAVDQPSEAAETASDASLAPPPSRAVARVVDTGLGPPPPTLAPRPPPPPAPSVPPPKAPQGARLEVPPPPFLPPAVAKADPLARMLYRDRHILTRCGGGPGGRESVVEEKDEVKAAADGDDPHRLLMSLMPLPDEDEITKGPR